MGGRGASSASSNGGYIKLDKYGNPKLDEKGNPVIGHYGEEFRSLATFDTTRGEVKVLETADGGSNKKPLETKTPNRIYATVNSDGHINNLYLYDENGLSKEEWHIGGHLHYGSKYHMHIGYYHSEGGGRALNASELRYVEEVERKWRSSQS